MSATSYCLMLVHRRLDAEIRNSMGSRLPDAIRIIRLKKLKLAVKDRLHALALGTMRTPRAA